MKQRGFTLTEALAVLAIGAVIVIAAVPSMFNAIKRSRLETAARTVASDVREARARSISSGWEYRVIGFHATTGGTRANQYRLLGRRSSATAWPANEAAVTSTSTQYAGAWVNIGLLFPRISLQPPAASFTLTFDSRGTSSDAATTFNPLTVAGYSGAQRTVTVSTVGSVRIQ